jgi:uncharacterized membrane protein YfcA
MTLIVVLAVIGLVGLVLGVLALRFISRTQRSGEAPPNWRWLRWTTLIFGAVLGIASWPLTFWMGYPIATPEGEGRIVGLPFFVAFFDSAGRDYVGPLTLVGCIANLAFWFMVPQMMAALYGAHWRRRRPQGTA